MTVPLVLAGEVEAALAQGQPVVAVETAFLTHGLSWPVNLETLRDLEAVIRAAGAVPAAIGLVAGQVRVGLEPPLQERLATADDRAKASVGDLAPLCLAGADAGLTVSATVTVAAWVGIPVMVTGGLGGVHRGAVRTFDISADLGALARSPVLVVCSGAKSVLDLPATLELLETLGVPVVGYQTDDFPAFYVARSGRPLAHRVETPAAAARLLHLQRTLGLPQAVVLAQPVPAEAALAAEAVERWLAEAERAAELAGVRGKAVTPYLLQALATVSQGATLRANLALLRANARLGAAVAVAYRQLVASEAVR